jgi:hypothetical protein
MSRNWPNCLGSPAILGSSGSPGWLLAGSEDPWRGVSDFRPICLFRSTYPATMEDFVNSGQYSAMYACGSFSAPHLRMGRLAAVACIAEVKPVTK